MKKSYFRTLSKKLNFGLLTVAVLLTVSGFINKATGQTTIYSTDFGTIPNVNPVAWTFTGLGMNTSTNTPSNYTGASGGVYLGEGNSTTFTNTSGNTQATSPIGTSAAVLLVSTTGYSNISVSFGMRKASATYDANATYSLQWSTDGTNYTNIAYTEPTLGSWGPISGAVLPAGANNQANLYVRWIFVRTGASSNIKIDDVVISSGPAPATISFLSNDTTATENSATAHIVVKLNATSTASSAVSVSVSALSSASGADYTLANTTVTFAANAPINSTAIVTVNITNDATIESSEYIILKLHSPVNAALGTINQHAFYIGDDDKVIPQPSNALSLNLLSSFSNGASGANSAEIVAHDPGSQRLFIANSIGTKLDIVDFVNPANPTLLFSIPVTPYGNINSVSVKNGIVAAAIENSSNPQDSGKVVFFDVNGTFLKSVKVGMMPDMITFNHAGTKVMTANEGEPNNAFTSDPDGSVSIIDISGGIAALTQTNVSHVTFTVYNGQEAALRTQGIRIYGAGASASKDFEPEYITISPDDSKAWVGLQENNALVEIDLSNNNINYIKALGTKDHSLLGNGFDASNQTKGVNIANFPVKGFYLPDAIASYTVGGNTYIISANEGDARAWSGFSEEARVSALNLDAAKFPNAAELKNNYVLGRLNVTNKSGDIDSDGDIDTIYTYGSRSFSIWNAATGALVYDSKDDFESITATNSFSVLFNASNSNSTKKDRSDDKGPEPEGVTIGMVGSNIYAFIALERVGGVMVYDVTNPNLPVFVTYVNNRSLPSNGPDLGSEGLIFITQANSPNGQHIVIAANEVSSTLSIWGIPGCTAPIATSLTASGTTSNVCVENAPVLSVPQDNGLTYQWSKNGVPVSGATSHTIEATTSGNYSVAITGGANCLANSRQMAVVIAPAPVLSVSGSSVTCFGGAITQTVSGAVTYSYNSLSTTSVINFTPSISGTYTITGIGSNSCRGTFEQSVTVNALPTLAITGSSAACAGSAISQTVSGAVTYSYNNASSTSVINFTPTASGDYTITGVDANSCSNTLVQNVTMNALPTLTITGSSVLCSGSAISQTISGAATYSLNTSTVTPVFNYTSSTSGTYTITGIDANGCMNTLTKSVTVNSTPTLVVSGPNSVCIGGAISQTVSGAITYSLNGASTSTLLSFTPSASGNYTIVGIDANNCKATSVKPVVVNALPVVNLYAVPAVICTGESATLTATGATSYSWSTGSVASTFSLSPAATTTYSVKGTDANGCSSSVTKTITVNSKPLVGATTANTLICVGESATLTASGGNTYLWDNGVPTVSIVVYPTSTMVYTVTGTNALNCSAKATITQSVSECTSLRESNLNSDDYMVYPNPAVNEISISYTAEAKIRVKLVNAIGAVVLEQNEYTSKSAINVSHLAKGIYFVQISSSNKHSDSYRSKKVIVE